MPFSPRSRARLTHHDLGRFDGATLFDRLGRAVCRAGCLPRKELYEAWEVARRARRLFRGGRVVDLCGGHGLLAHVMLVLDASSPGALVVDQVLPPSSERLHDVLASEWPRLEGRVSLAACSIEDVALLETDVVVSSHACGSLTDTILERAVAAGARVAVLPCCHERANGDTGGLDGWMDLPLALDTMRALRVGLRGYRIRTQVIPAAITPKNRLLLAWKADPHTRTSRHPAPEL